MAEKKIDVYDFPMRDCIQEQNGGPYFSSIVRLESKWYCYHATVVT